MPNSQRALLEAERLPIASALEREGEAAWDRLSHGRKAQEGSYRALSAAVQEGEVKHPSAEAYRLHKTVGNVFGKPPKSGVPAR